ncbi:MAG: gamma-D-glutamyl-meso-diaminopimelate peptidase [Clostridia bacterium]|nr:gamma-D-glutamyl-meso-diaminopimelate peptidase [Clostridia bacterium]
MKETKFSFFEKPPDRRRRREIEGHLAAAYPALVREEIGKSHLGEPLALYRFGEGKQSILYVGAHHGMEWITALLLYRFIGDLCLAHIRRGMGDLLANKRLYILPILNPDGVDISLRSFGKIKNKRFIRWQANARGVDLNHNYDAGFAAYKEIERANGIHPGPTRYSGPHPFSEPETQVMHDLLEELRPDLTLSLHTQGEEIFYCPTDPPVCGARRMGETLAQILGYRLGQADGCAAYGGLSDYIATALRLPAYTLECGRGCNPLPIGQAKEIYPRLRRALLLALTLV